MRIKADAFRYDRRTRILTATGNVVLTTPDVEIRADSLTANLETGTLQARGHVRLRVGSQEVAADVLTYDLNTHQALLQGAQAKYTGPFVLGVVSLRAQELRGEPDRFAVAREAFATTCDPNDPVLHLTARELSVVANDRIVGRRVTLWVAGRKVITLPYFIIFLRQRRATRLTPVVGYSDAEGWFAKTSYAYVLNDDHFGYLHADWMERLGVGLGIEHFYRLMKGEGAALLYNLANRQTGGSDLRSVLNHAQEIAPGVRARFYTDYQSRTTPGIAPVTAVYSTFDLSRTGDRSSSYVYATASHSSLGALTSLSSRVVHLQTLSPQLYAEGVVDLTRTSSPSGTDDEALPHLALRYFGAKGFASLVLDTRLDPDGSRFVGDDYYTLERLPEVNVSLLPFRVRDTFLVGQVEGGLARFRETLGGGGRTLDASRADLTAIVSGPVPIGKLGTLGVRMFGRGTWYSTGDTRLFYGGRLEYLVPLGGWLEARVGYFAQTVVGRSPFVFDQIQGTLSVADAQISLGTVSFSARAFTSYDFQTRQFGSLVAQAYYVPRPGWSIGLAASFNPNLRQLERVETALDVRLSKDWEFQYIGTYDGFQQRLMHDRVSLTRVFCNCWAVSVTYYGAREEIWLETWLTALPWARGKLGIGARGDLLFDQPFPFLPR